MVKVRIQTSDSVTDVEGEGSLMDLAEIHNLPIPFGCHAGRCGVCQVEVIDGKLAEPGKLEEAILEGFGCPKEARLACQAFLDDHADVTLRAVHE
ncbi:MAG: 2Fe-2S iron-sulfur cluster-binding protein [Planctomycetota bacterium]|nr:2Fe-2S iron-sulfur cluster-binding protein [Planctomycetota bacterium]MDA1114537.1 2Fe-2S iron-sulfur cluster-binding protein [Planctomycetota bacterium]